MAKRQPKGMPKNLRLVMIEDDIATAVCNSRRHCAIAQTIYRQLKHPIGRVRVMQSGVSIDGTDEYRYHYRTPQPAARLVRDFDDHKPVKPITFVLQYTNRRKIQPVDPERKRQVNEARRARVAALAAAGEKPKTYARGRYGI